MNILFLASYYPNRVRQTGPFMRRHAEAISEYCNVYVLTSDPDFSLKDRKYEIITLEENSLKVVRVYYNPNTLNIPVIKSIIRFIRFFLGLLKGYHMISKQWSKPDLVHLNVIHPSGIFAIWLKIIHRLPLIITEHSSLFINENFTKQFFLNRLFQKLILSISDKITTVSRIQGETMVKFKLIKKFEVVPNVINTAIFSVKNKKTKNHPIEILHVSNLQHWKGIENILKAIQIVSTQRQDFILRIVGDGANRSYYEKLAESLFIKNKFVNFEGYKSETEVASFMRSADFFVLNSESESFCCVMLEAMACGLPIIAPDCGAIPENMDKQKGILMPDRSVDSLTAAISTMLNNYARYNSKEMAATISKKFPPEVVGKQFYQIYQSLLTIK